MKNILTPHLKAYPLRLHTKTLLMMMLLIMIMKTTMKTLEVHLPILALRYYLAT